MAVVPGLVAVLQQALRDQPAQSFAWKRWHDPEPGQTIAVVTTAGSWHGSPNSARFPAVTVELWTAPTAGQSDAESISEPIADRVHKAVHWVDRTPRTLDGTRILSCLVAGSAGPADVEGRDGWCWRRVTVELVIG